MPKTIEQLDRLFNMCRYIVNGEVRDALYCGEPTVHATSFCREHFKACYNGIPKRGTAAHVQPAPSPVTLRG